MAEKNLKSLEFIDDRRAPCAPVRIGFALGNEFSDHVTERQNYLLLAHSKLRPASLGPELLIGDLPLDVRGASRIRRGKEVIWEKPFLSGEQNMAHSIANLEAHHFKYAPLRRPGDVHAVIFSARRRCHLSAMGVKTAQKRRRVRDRALTLSVCRCATGSGPKRTDENEGASALVTGSEALRRNTFARGELRAPWRYSPMTVARARCHQPLRRGRDGPCAFVVAAAGCGAGFSSGGLGGRRRSATVGCALAGSRLRALGSTFPRHRRRLATPAPWAAAASLLPRRFACRSWTAYGSRWNNPPRMRRIPPRATE